MHIVGGCYTACQQKLPAPMMMITLLHYIALQTIHMDDMSIHIHRYDTLAELIVFASTITIYNKLL